VKDIEDAFEDQVEPYDRYRYWNLLSLDLNISRLLKPPAHFTILVGRFMVYRCMHVKMKYSQWYDLLAFQAGRPGFNPS
jgi:hypothetical protein